MEINKNMEIKVSTNNYDIINSGSVVLQMGEYLEFEIHDLRFRFEFIDEEPNGNTPLEGRIVSRVENKDTPDAYYKIIFYNQTSSFFASTSNFAQLAIIDDKPLKLKFCIQSINNQGYSSDKIFFYTWYLGKEQSTQINNNCPKQ
jgi:hypothetical protein